MLQKWQRLLFFDKNNGDKFSTENPEKDLMDLLIRKTISAGHKLSFIEASNDPEMVQPNSYAFYFGSFDEAAGIAWLRARPPNSGSDGLTDKGRKLVRALKEIRQTTGKPYRREVNWMSEPQETKNKGKGSRYTIEEVKAVLVDFYNRTKRLPVQKDTQKYNSGLPSWGTMIRFLGPKSGWQGIVDSAKASPAPEEPPIAEDTPQDIVVDEDVSKEVVAEAPEEALVVTSSNDGNDAQVKTTHKVQGNLAIVDIKITLPGREQPILVTLAV